MQVHTSSFGKSIGTHPCAQGRSLGRQVKQATALSIQYLLYPWPVCHVRHRELPNLSWFNSILLSIHREFSELTTLWTHS